MRRLAELWAAEANSARHMCKEMQNLQETLAPGRLGVFPRLFEGPALPTALLFLCLSLSWRKEVGLRIHAKGLAGWSPCLHLSRFQLQGFCDKLNCYATHDDYTQAAAWI